MPGVQPGSTAGIFAARADDPDAQGIWPGKGDGVFPGMDFGVYPGRAEEDDGSLSGDDVIEGTWVPELAGFTDPGVFGYLVNQGRFTRIGKMVIATFTIMANSIGEDDDAPSGNLTIQGFPYNAIADDGVAGGAFGITQGLLPGDGYVPNFQLNGGTKIGTVTGQTALDGSGVNVDSATMLAVVSGLILISGFICYQTDDPE